ncbi:MAG: alpha/beta fold hydrolase [Deltaproteobacteria bacterium]|jgi:pimeloyl-ACP methyl ester carboxylesterase|nr:alpha/beta fold hydrolase [Deltaproteobacteria bacterium]
MITILSFLIILIKLVVALTALTVLLSFTVAWYERANTKPDLIERRFTLRGVGISIWLLILETVCLLVTIILRPFGWINPKISPKFNGKKTPIILLHGLFQNRACLFILEHYLRRAGFNNVYSINTPPWRDIETLTESLVKKVDELRLAFKVDKVLLVGHSMGGMIGRNYVQNRGGSSRVEHLITLGTPHYGSKLAPFAISSMGRSLLPGSDFLKTFNSVNWPRETALTCIYTRYDNIVLPAKNARLDGAENIELDGMGHTALLFHPQSLSRIVDALNRNKS